MAGGKVAGARRERWGYGKWLWEMKVARGD